MSYATIRFYLKSIPASEKKPFELKVAGQTIYVHKKDILKKPLVLEAEVPEPKYATKLTIFTQCIISELDINHYQKFDVTNHGDYIEISYIPRIGISYTQRFDGRFGSGGDEVIHNDSTDTFDYSSTALDPNLTNYVKKGKKKVEEKFTTKHAFFHFLNLPASFKEPLTLHVNRKLAYTMTKSQRMNREEILKVDLPEGKNEIFVRLQIRVEGYDVQQRFNLKRNGNHIQFAIADDQLRVAQRTDKRFKKIPPQKARPKQEEEEEEEEKQRYGGGKRNLSIVHFYLCNIDATSVKKFIMRLNGSILHKIDQKIPKDQVLHVKGEFERPNRGEHIVKISFSVPAKGFFEPYEDEFNLDKYGKHIKLEVIDEYDRKGNVTSSQISVEQDHKKFKFENSTEDTNENNWKKKEPKREERKVEKPKKKEEPTYDLGPKKSEAGSELDELETLAELLEAGILTQAEFNYKKKKILGL